MEKIKNKIKDFCKNYFGLALFVLIFAVFCFIYNLNSQTLNFYLKKGTILEYSINPTQKIDKEKIDNGLLDLGFKYSYVEEYKPETPIYDTESKKISKKLIISLPYILKENKKDLFNKVSDYVFKNFPSSKLTDTKVLGHLYSDKYSAFITFLTLIMLSFAVWCLVMNLILPVNFFVTIKTNIINFFIKKKEDTKKLFENTKKQGIGYFLKQIFLDNCDTDDNNATKEIINTIVFVLVAVILIRFFIGELRWIPSESMYPTIKKRDRVYVEKLEYPKRTIERGDILVFYPPNTKLSNSIFAVLSRLTGIACKDVAYIKRVVGMPNDKFEIKFVKEINEYRVFINDKMLNEPYTNNIFNTGYEYPPVGYDSSWTPCSHPDVKYCGPFTIPSKKYFMMGDNRGNSADSRFWGFLDEDRIIGRANFMFWPLSRINLMKDKYIILDKELKNNEKIKEKFIIDRYSL